MKIRALHVGLDLPGLAYFHRNKSTVDFPEMERVSTISRAKQRFITTVDNYS